MKVLFVDDEPLIRMGLRAIIAWEELGFHHFFEAENAKEALEIIDEHEPELMILDICMESVSGIVLAGQLREKDYKGRIILLSGYSNFEYAQKAFYADVTAYLVKPVDKEELLSAVNKAIDELYKESLISILSDQTMEQSRENLLTNLITGKMKYTEEMEKTYHIKLQSDYYRMASVSLEQVDEKNVRDDFYEKVAKDYLAVAISNAEYAIILTNQASVKSFIELWKEFCVTHEAIQKAVCVISSQVNRHEGIAQLYDENKEILNSLYYYKEKDNILIESEFLQKKLQNVTKQGFDMIEFTNTLAQDIITLQTDKIERSLILLQEFLRMKKQPRDSIHFLLVNCYLQIMQVLCDSYPILEVKLPTKEQYTQAVYSKVYLCDEIAYLKSVLVQAVWMIEEQSKPDICERLCQYIALNYASPLKLETIAEEFHYNSAYLGKLFQKKTGEYFNSYVDKVRIENAKKYLEKGATVQQACENCGYANTDYFTKKFKKHVGMVPSEYKNQFVTNGTKKI